MVENLQTELIVAAIDRLLDMNKTVRVTTDDVLELLETWRREMREDEEREAEWERSCLMEMKRTNNLLAEVRATAIYNNQHLAYGFNAINNNLQVLQKKEGDSGRGATINVTGGHNAATTDPETETTTAGSAATS